MSLAGVPTGTGAAAAVDDGSTAVLTRPFLRAATRARYNSAPAFLRVATRARYNSAPAFLRAAPTASLCAAPTASLRAVSLLGSVQSSNSVRAPLFSRPAPVEAAAKGRNVKRRCSAPGKEPGPEVPTKWAKIVALLNKLKWNIGLLVLLGLSLCIGFLAVKEEQMAMDIVDVCDKAHKIYNICSKGFLIIADMLKGDK